MTHEYLRQSDPNFVADLSRRRFLRRIGEALMLAGVGIGGGTIALTVPKVSEINEVSEKEARQRITKPTNQDLLHAQKNAADIRNGLQVNEQTREDTYRVLGQQTVYSSTYNEIRDENGLGKYFNINMGGIMGGLITSVLGFAIRAENSKKRRTLNAPKLEIQSPDSQT